jgi:hypothetical protein
VIKQLRAIENTIKFRILYWSVRLALQWSNHGRKKPNYIVGI